MNYISRIFFIIYNLWNFMFFKKIHNNSSVMPSVRIEGKKYITISKHVSIQRLGWLLAIKIDECDPVINIGENCAIGDFSHIAAVRGIYIENNVLIANKVYIADNLHSYEDISVPVINQPVIFKSVVRIKSGAWIGENVCIIGATIGKNSVIGANSVVTNDIPDYSVAVGSPARVIKVYDFKSQTWIKSGNNIN